MPLGDNEVAGHKAQARKSSPIPAPIESLAQGPPTFCDSLLRNNIDYLYMDKGKGPLLSSVITEATTPLAGAGPEPQCWETTAV